MKPEPLKDKQKYYLDAEKIHESRDIKSTVEWLKEELNKIRKERGAKTRHRGHRLALGKTIEIIDKAFEDVVK
jgi:hypothetical protein|tara:strand:+ start:268 stop:486 length:219 start_codon:yes stop_codon:yes gene_type:complete